MKELDVLSLEGKATGKVALPSVFESEVRPELIQRAVVAENTLKLQPQGHYPLAGMQTTARYYGRMHAFRTGRHMGGAIRPRQKLGGGAQGLVRRIPSATKGKRAHPHMIEKTLVEQINKREYQKALESAISAAKSVVAANEIESIKKTKQMLNAFNNMKLSKELESSEPRIRRGLRRSSRSKSYGKSVLLVISKNDAAIKAARNIAGVDACEVSKITANLLAPGGVPGRTTIWSERAVKELEESIKRQKLQ